MLSLPKRKQTGQCIRWRPSNLKLDFGTKADNLQLKYQIVCIPSTSPPHLIWTIEGHLCKILQLRPYFQKSSPREIFAIDLKATNLCKGDKNTKLLASGKFCRLERELRLSKKMVYWMILTLSKFLKNVNNGRVQSVFITPSLPYMCIWKSEDLGRPSLYF